jgi:hypothetical protein
LLIHKNDTDSVAQYAIFTTLVPMCVKCYCKTLTKGHMTEDINAYTWTVDGSTFHEQPFQNTNLICRRRKMIQQPTRPKILEKPEPVSFRLKKGIITTYNTHIFEYLE